MKGNNNRSREIKNNNYIMKNEKEEHKNMSRKIDRPRIKSYVT